MNQLQVALNCRLLHKLSAADSSAFLDLGRRQQIRAGTFLFLQDDPATLFYILLSGTVRLAQLTPEGHQIILRHVTPGEGFGIIVVLAKISYPVSAETVADGEVLSWDGETLAKMMLEVPQLAINGLDMLASYFVQLQDRFRELATQRVERRVAHALLRLVRQTGRRTDVGILIDMPLSRQDLAEMTGTTLYTTSRILSQWERQGWISTGRERVTLVRPHDIVSVAEDLPHNPSPDA